MLGELPDEIARQLDAIGGPLPEVAIGAHCFEPRDCPFMKRCWPDSPRHISNLYNVGPKKTVQYMADGVHIRHRVIRCDVRYDRARVR